MIYLTLILILYQTNRGKGRLPFQTPLFYVKHAMKSHIHTTKFFFISSAEEQPPTPCTPVGCTTDIDLAQAYRPIVLHISPIRIKLKSNTIISSHIIILANKVKMPYIKPNI